METTTPYLPYGIRLSENEIKPPVLKRSDETLDLLSDEVRSLIEALQQPTPNGISIQPLAERASLVKGSRANAIFLDDEGVPESDLFHHRCKLEEEFKYAGNARTKLVEIGLQDYIQAKQNAQLEIEKLFNVTKPKASGLTVPVEGEKMYVSTRDIKMNAKIGSKEHDPKVYRIRRDEIDSIAYDDEGITIRLK